MANYGVNPDDDNMLDFEHLVKLSEKEDED